MLYIRTDGNEEIGVGHLMRCLSIADAAVKVHLPVRFLLADSRGEQLVKSRGHQCTILHTDYRKLEEELPALEAVFQEEAPVFILVDSYAATARYLEALGAFGKTGYLDDFGREAYGAGLIINYNIYAPRLSYQTLYDGKKAKLLLGSGYAPLRPEFQAMDGEYRVREQAESILITTGGADCYNVAGQLAERLLRKLRGDRLAAAHADVKIHIVSGPFHSFRDRLVSLSRKEQALVIHENVTAMAELMASCDVAVSAAGSTLYELCVIGVPTVYFSFADNQELPARYFSEDCLMRNAGNYAEEAEETLERLTEECCSLMDSRDRRLMISESMKTVMDGKGAERIAEAIRREMDASGRQAFPAADDAGGHSVAWNGACGSRFSAVSDTGKGQCDHGQ